MEGLKNCFFLKVNGNRKVSGEKGIGKDFFLLQKQETSFIMILTCRHADKKVISGVVIELIIMVFLPCFFLRR